MEKHHLGVILLLVLLKDLCASVILNLYQQFTTWLSSNVKLFADDKSMFPIIYDQSNFIKKLEADLEKELFKSVEGEF